MNGFHRTLLLALLCLAPFQARSSVLEIKAEKKKIKHVTETIQLGDTTFEIPFPWSGNRIRVPSIPDSSFKMIPVEHAHKGTHLYITEKAHSALIELLADAKEDGLTLTIESGYRSPGYQKKIFIRMINEGREFSDIIRYVAPPGYSQHALGTAVDFFPSNWRFAELADYKWLQENAVHFGFSETYPKNNALHYPWEAWHWNYTGKTRKQADSDLQGELPSP